VADHVDVDVELLRRTGDALGRVTQILGQARRDVDADLAAIAQRDLGEALREFESNWRVRRERLIESVTNGGRLCAEAARAYEKLDTDLAGAVTPEGAV
jgi:hypothetical protein